MPKVFDLRTGEVRDLPEDDAQELVDTERATWWPPREEEPKRGRSKK